MKRQVLLVTLLLVTSTYAFSQKATHGSTPLALTCDLTNPLEPVAGRSYTYTATVDQTGAASTAFWYATRQTQFTSDGSRAHLFIPGSGDSILANTNYGSLLTDPAGAGTSTSTSVTWSSKALSTINSTTNPLFMVLDYKGQNCANNLKVMQIVPKNAFLVDITNLANATQTAIALADTATTPEAQCYANVAGASFNGTNVDIDYGTNVLYFEVIAANFTGSYKPTLQLSGLKGTQTAAIDWGYVKGTYDQVLVADQAHASGVITSPEFTVETDDNSTDDGVSIYVRVTIKNHGYEGLSNDVIRLAVDAVDGTTERHNDVKADCADNLAFADYAKQTLNARPSVTPGTTMVPQNP